jgi:hypothetical protein
MSANVKNVKTYLFSDDNKVVLCAGINDTIHKFQAYDPFSHKCISNYVSECGNNK